MNTKHQLVVLIDENAVAVSSRGFRAIVGIYQTFGAAFSHGEVALRFYAGRADEAPKRKPLTSIIDGKSYEVIEMRYPSLVIGPRVLVYKQVELSEMTAICNQLEILQGLEVADAEGTTEAPAAHAG